MAVGPRLALLIFVRARCLGAARFTTCCLRFKYGVATPLPSSLPAGWLAFTGKGGRDDLTGG